MRRGLYSKEPAEPEAFTRRFDRFYTRFARLYDVLITVAPVWRTWLAQALPHIVGPRVLEVSCGTGYLLTKYAGQTQASAIDLNANMVEIARKNLRKVRLDADVRQANVESLPYPNGSFDTVINTMAFSGYPNGHAAISEMARVLRTGGRLVLIDVGYPEDQNWLGTLLAELWRWSGDLIRDMDPVFREAGLAYSKRTIGGFGSVILYLATKIESPRPPAFS